MKKFGICYVLNMHYTFALHVAKEVLLNKHHLQLAEY